MDNTLNTSADILAQNRILYGAGGGFGGYGYGAHGGVGNGIGTDTNSRAVLHSELRHVQANQALGFDRMQEQAEITRDFAAREAIASNFANLQLGLADKFSALAMQNSECCCELKAGQAEIKTAIAAQAVVKAAEDRVRSDTKLDLLLARECKAS